MIFKKKQQLTDIMLAVFPPKTEGGCEILEWW